MIMLYNVRIRIHQIITYISATHEKQALYRFTVWEVIFTGPFWLKLKHQWTVVGGTNAKLNTFSRGVAGQTWKCLQVEIQMYLSILMMEYLNHLGKTDSHFPCPYSPRTAPLRQSACEAMGSPSLHAAGLSYLGSLFQLRLEAGGPNK